MRRFSLGRVDPDGLGEMGGLRCPLDEALGVSGEGGGEDLPSLLADAISQAEVDDGEMSEAQAIDVASRLLRENQLACFDLAGRRATIQKRLGQG